MKRIKKKPKREGKITTEKEVDEMKRSTTKCAGLKQKTEGP